MCQVRYQARGVHPCRWALGYKCQDAAQERLECVLIIRYIRADDHVVRGTPWARRVLRHIACPVKLKDCRRLLAHCGNTVGNLH